MQLRALVLGRYIYDMDWISSHIRALRTRTEMVLKMTVFSSFNHLLG
jgi:hypothetical protein